MMPRGSHHSVTIIVPLTVVLQPYPYTIEEDAWTPANQEGSVSDDNQFVREPSSYTGRPN
ncbi:MAG: hypothetical protein NVS2B7_17980 [Herpetosiphon sp.]